MTTYWNQNSENDFKILPALEKNLSCDIAIIGGGYAGLSTALELKEKYPNLNISLFEDKTLGFGASGRNGGWLVPFPPLFWLAESPKNLERHREHAFAIEYTKKNIEKLKLKIRNLIGEEDWKDTNHQLIARNRVETATLKWLKTRLDKLGFKCDYFDFDQRPQRVGYNYKACLTWQTAIINPFKVIQIFRDFCLEKNISVYENTCIAEVQSNMNPIVLKTKNNFLIHAEKVILCTNAYSDKLQIEYDSPGATIQHTYMVATEPLDQILKDKISANDQPFGDPSYFYYCGRFHKDRLLFNGVDRKSNATEEDDKYEPAYQNIYEELIRRFPLLRDQKIESAWAGPVLQTRTDAPIVKLSRANPNLVFNIGYGGGSGISMALQSGRLVRALLDPTEAENQDAIRMLNVLNSTEFPIIGSTQVVATILRKMFFN